MSWTPEIRHYEGLLTQRGSSFRQMGIGLTRFEPTQDRIVLE